MSVPPSEKVDDRNTMVFFLGGHDLEMLTIRDLLGSEEIVFYDKGLAWGANASEYREEIKTCLEGALRPVFIELTDDFQLDSQQDRDKVIIVDHHGDLAGKDKPTSLEQVFKLIQLPEEKWTRDFELVSANDRGALRALQAANASTEEMIEIRKRDREAQKITEEEEESGRLAAKEAVTYAAGKLTVVRMPHAKMATVTDVLHSALGGKGYENILILSPGETFFSGSGRAIEHLKLYFPGGWYGGELPDQGYWGNNSRLDESEVINLLEESMSTKPASEIEVKSFRHIVMFPVLLRGRPQSNHSDAGLLQPWVDAFTDKSKCQHWKELEPNVGAGVLEQFRYEQIVYYHPFVRDFLFGDGQSEMKDRSTRVLTRSDVVGVDVVLGNGEALSFEVPRVQMYLCKPCVAILAIELTSPKRTGVDKPDKVTLDLLQDFTDQFRRIYPPFWRDGQNPDSCSPGLCLKELKWVPPPKGLENTIDDHEDTQKNRACNQLNKSEKFGLNSPRKNFEEFTRVGGEPPLFDHWQWFFGPTVTPFQHQGHVDLNSVELHIQQVLDERMPVMSYFAVENPDEVSIGDKDRLTFVDASGNDPFPYEKQFLEQRRDRYQYNRFAHYKTHYYCSGYGFSMLGVAGDYQFENILPAHFSNHYFCMGLIAHYQKAALLYFADELSTTGKKLANKNIDDELSDREYRERIERIQHRYLKFRSRSFFEEVSNQLQGRELFQVWYGVLETQKLFELVDSTSERMSTFLAERESLQLSRLATNTVPWVIALTVASAMFTAFDLWKGENSGKSPMMFFGFAMILSSIAGGISWWLIKTRSERSDFWKRIGGNK